eukprot:4461070-Pyramimonas_sp.AAC.1
MDIKLDPSTSSSSMPPGPASGRSRQQALQNVPGQYSTHYLSIGGGFQEPDEDVINYLLTR